MFGFRQFHVLVIHLKFFPRCNSQVWVSWPFFLDFMPQLIGGVLEAVRLAWQGHSLNLIFGPDCVLLGPGSFFFFFFKSFFFFSIEVTLIYNICKFALVLKGLSNLLLGF